MSKSLWARRLGSKVLNIADVAEVPLGSTVPMSPTMTVGLDALALFWGMDVHALIPLLSHFSKDAPPSHTARTCDLEASLQSLSLEHVAFQILNTIYRQKSEFTHGVDTALLAARAALSVLELSTFETYPDASHFHPKASDSIEDPSVSRADAGRSRGGDHFAINESPKRKGRARMSQEKRKRLARRKEREALMASVPQAPVSAPVTIMSFQPPAIPYNHLYGRGLLKSRAKVSKPGFFQIPLAHQDQGSPWTKAQPLLRVLRPRAMDPACLNDLPSPVPSFTWTESDTTTPATSVPSTPQECPPSFYPILVEPLDLPSSPSLIVQPPSPPNK
ncbi:hypothetical protein IE53DRAFT_67529 [Violaceomyces palustris]|uniref:Uncharacterized protein n=1 Tax=Violaceomyces palustris TaxID=1673888 RepID=A0ACD0NYW6_9BASI|nr:hypothetical protein IE53DRAFT_67529 [Violaceomyces palustris]